MGKIISTYISGILKNRVFGGFGGIHMISSLKLNNCRTAGSAEIGGFQEGMS
jgi:hypothetical protein